MEKHIVPRHEFNSENKNIRVSFFREIESEIKDDLQFDSQNAGLIFQDAFYAIGDAVVINSPKKDVIEILRLVTELGINYFRNALADPNSTISMSIRDELFEVEAKPENAYSDPAYWARYFYCATISKNKKAINELITIPENVFRSSEIVYDEVDFAIVRFLKGLYQDVKLAPILLEAIKLTNQELNNKERYDYLDYIKLPELELYTRIFSNDNEGFNLALIEALENHKKFWKKKPNDTEGWISFPIICACIVALETHDFKIEVESDYLPIWLVTGEYL